MRGVSGNNVLNTGAGGTFNQDGILIVPIIDAERVLAIDAKGIDQFKEGEYFSDDLPGLGVNIFFSLNTRGRFTVLLRHHHSAGQQDNRYLLCNCEEICDEAKPSPCVLNKIYPVD